jgi:hypothetical protein
LIGEDQTQWLSQQTDYLVVSEMLREKNAMWKRFMERLVGYRHFVNDLNADHLLQDPDRLIYSNEISIDGLHVQVSSLNTAWSAGTGHGSEKGKLWLGMHQLQWAIEESDGARINILLSHHPAAWLNQYEENDVLRRIRKYFTFYLHGHNHDDWLCEVGDNIQISGGAILEHPNIQTGYNLCKLHLREKTGEVHLRTFDTKGRGWIPHIIHGKTSSSGIWPISHINLPDINNGKREKPIKSTAATPKLKIDPFRYFTVASEQVDENLFVGRKNEISAGILGLKADSASLVIYGKAGVGKSSLALQLAHIAAGRHKKLIDKLQLDYLVPEDGFHFPVAYYSCTRDLDVDMQNVYFSVLTSNSKAFTFGRLLESPKMKAHFSTMVGQLHLEQFRQLHIQGRTQRNLQIAPELFSHLASAVKNIHHLPLFMVIDEFNTVKEKALVATDLKRYSDIKFCMVGTADDVRVLVDLHGSIPRQIAEGHVLVKPMADVFCKEIVKREVERSGGEFEFTTEATCMLADCAKGMPFFVHFFGRFSLFEAITSDTGARKPLRVEKLHVQEAMAKKISLLVDLDRDYLAMVKDDPRREVMLKILAYRGGEDFAVANIVRASLFCGFTKQGTAAYIAAFVKNGILKKSAEKRFQFSDARIRIFIRLRQPINDVSKEQLRAVYGKLLRDDNWDFPINFRYM